MQTTAEQKASRDGSPCINTGKDCYKDFNLEPQPSDCGNH